MRFPGAPFYATFTEDGLMLVHDEAWSEAEWSMLSSQQRRAITGDVWLLDETPEQEQGRKKRLRDRISRDRRAA